MDLRMQPAPDSPHQLPFLTHGKGTAKRAKWVVRVQAQDQQGNQRKGASQQVTGVVV